MNYSKQRESIKEYLKSTKLHPTAEMVYTVVKEENPKISLATVYRNLNLLVDAGEARRITTGDGTDHFDGDISPHSHYHCRCCHKIYDIDVVCSLDQVLAASSLGFGTVESADILFTGLCKDCSKN